MKNRQIGKSDLTASVIGMGTWAIGGGEWWGDNDEKESIRTIQYAVDQGITWIDTAPAYGFGLSEEVVGKAIKSCREKVVLSTKCGLEWREKGGSLHVHRDGRDLYRNLAPESIRKDLEDSLRRLQTDYIDVYYTHWQSVGDVAIEDTMQELMKMKQEGKIRAIGASNVTVAHLEEYLKYGQLDVIQERYSMVDRKIEKELMPFCNTHQITIQAYSPIEQGLLTGKVSNDRKLTPGDIRNSQVSWLPQNRILINQMLDGWKDLAEKYQCAIGNLVIAWTAEQSPYMNVLCGARKVHQVEENVLAGKVELELEDLKRMTKDANEVVEKMISK